MRTAKVLARDIQPSGLSVFVCVRSASLLRSIRDKSKDPTSHPKLRTSSLTILLRIKRNKTKDPPARHNLLTIYSEQKDSLGVGGF